MEKKDKTVLITGGAIRIGKILSISAARAGFNIILHYNHSVNEAEETAEIIRDLGGRVTLAKADLNDISSIRDFTNKVFTETQVDVLINNAAIFKNLSFERTTLQDWEEHIRINLTAPFLLSQTFASQDWEKRKGKIINILDWRALRPGPDHFPYTISKTGMAGMTQSLAAALAPKIQVNGIALGAVLPPTGSVDMDDPIRNVPMQRWATVDELETTIQFLLEAPEYITGEIIHLDGGRHLV
ncbi:MAG: SDR family NAD(P)-dependent oxidoreductase [Anaerolineales bacterium]|nr:SDR family NAD(P)-dependent oxidoreductase [Anaerolineales bacterium]